MAKYYLIVGEASGDLHGSNLMKALRVVDPDADFRYFGGDLMAAQGGTLVRHYRDTAIMGFVRVAMNLGKIFANIDFCEKDIESYNPDAVILIDYPGFNLKIAKYVKEKLALPVHYYIPPKIWAWKKGRVRQIRRYVDAVYAIFPFEVDFYARYGYKAVYAGNPVVEAVRHHKVASASREEFARRNGLDPDKRIVALLPGSRRQEVSLTIPLFEAIDKSRLDDCQFVVAATSAVDAHLYDEVKSLKMVFDQTYDLLTYADGAVVNSGTATLETALFGVPQVVCYPMRIPGFLYDFARRFVIRIKHISLVNIIARRGVVAELVAKHATADNLQRELELVMNNSEVRENITKGYNDISAILGDSIASECGAEMIKEYVDKGR